MGRHPVPGFLSDLLNPENCKPWAATTVDWPGSYGCLSGNPTEQIHTVGMVQCLFVSVKASDVTGINASRFPRILTKNWWI
jgi:hypothetical protein